ncbi:MAG: DHH family phosphoesterase [Candidatus Bathyarchaeia archaeon]
MPGERGDLEGFLSEAGRVGSQIRDKAGEGLRFLVVSHFDADGLAAGAIMAKALLRWGASIHVKVAMQLDEATLKSLKPIERDITVFSEIGSGYLNLITENIKGPVFILDHHPPGDVETEAGPGIVHLNPMIYGFDGGREISGSGVNYLAVKAADPGNINLAPLAVVGALGDMQDRNEKRELLSLNRLVVEDGVKAGLLKVERDLIFYGRETRPIHRALASTTTPFLPGLTGREDACLAFLSSVEIPVREGERWRTVASLTMEEKKRLISGIVEYLTVHGFQGSLAQGLLGGVYTLTMEEEGSILRDAREYSSALNACGRMDKPGLGIAVCLGDRGESLRELEDLVREYRQVLGKHMDWIAQNPDRIQSLEGFHIVRGEDYIDENLVGAVASMLSASALVAMARPPIVPAKSRDGLVKISARATEKLVMEGVKLGEAFSALSTMYSGIGGGHDIAAGAQIPPERLEEYLEKLNGKLSRQRTRAAASHYTKKSIHEVDGDAASSSTAPTQP